MRRLIFITILVLTNFYLSGQVWRKYDVNALNSIVIDNQGNKWFSTYHGVYKFDNTNWTKLDTTNGLATNSITSILIDKSNNQWFGSYTSKYITPNIDSIFVTKYDGENWTKYNVNDSTKNDDYSAIWDIKEDNSGKIWFATTSGITMFDGTNWKNYHIKDGLPSEYIRCIAIDKSDNKWFGTQNGLSKFDGVTWTTYNTPDSLSKYSGNIILSIAFDNKGDLWIGGGKGLYKFKDSKLVNASSSINTSITAIAFDENDGMWLGLYNGFISKGKTRITSANEGIESIAIDSNNNVWLGTYTWAVKYEDTPLIFNVYPELVELDTLSGSKNYFVINSNTDWSLHDNDCCSESWLNYNKTEGSNIDTIWVTATEDYYGYSRSSQVYISEFGLTTKTVTVTRGETSDVSNLKNLDINIYPNPVIDNLFVKSVSLDNIDELEIYSIDGAFLEVIKKPKNAINMSHFKEGAYFLKINFNNSTVIKKIIKVNK